MGRPNEARQATNRARDLYEHLHEDFPAERGYRAKLAVVLGNIGNRLFESGQLHDADLAYRRALAVLERLAEDFRHVPQYRHELAIACVNVGTVLLGSKRTAQRAREDEELCRKAVRLEQAVVTECPGVAKYRRGLVFSLRYLARTLLQRGEHAEAARAAVETVPASGSGPRDEWETACLLGRCIQLVRVDGTLPLPRREAVEQKYADQAIDHLRRAIRKGFRDEQRLKWDPALALLRPREDFQALLRAARRQKKP
jgi:hypothetical protein